MTEGLTIMPTTKCLTTLPEKADIQMWGHGDRPSNTITSSCAFRHPTERRNLHAKEYAILQGFQHEYQFGKNGIKKQIANAQPPTYGERLYSGIRDHLARCDGYVA